MVYFDDCTCGCTERPALATAITPAFSFSLQPVLNEKEREEHTADKADDEGDFDDEKRHFAHFALASSATCPPIIAVEPPGRNGLTGTTPLPGSIADAGCGIWTIPTSNRLAFGGLIGEAPPPSGNEPARRSPPVSGLVRRVERLSCSAAERQGNRY